MIPPAIMIHWYDDAGEHDEQWPSIDRFLSWCASEGLTPQWIAYAQDPDDGEWVPFARS